MSQWKSFNKNYENQNNYNNNLIKDKNEAEGERLTCLIEASISDASEAEMRSVIKGRSRCGGWIRGRSRCVLMGSVIRGRSRCGGD
ncbi:hypothetical protein RchiOBHm_Chr1g0372311 [Rosa chinensis]|uniref:Uncharacterized protein n=1 Tax=Rosa chinensis TaxID=74649 RepID=A0A2P6SLU6_ROSCH|nr:hypothetical protein RchiOBHm_Chr1g0372311 [Rosa chinensis]